MDWLLISMRLSHHTKLFHIPIFNSVVIIVQKTVLKSKICQGWFCRKSYWNLKDCRTGWFCQDDLRYRCSSIFFYLGCDLRKMEIVEICFFWEIVWPQMLPDIVLSAGKIAPMEHSLRPLASRLSAWANHMNQIATRGDRCDRNLDGRASLPHDLIMRWMAINRTAACSSSHRQPQTTQPDSDTITRPHNQATIHHIPPYPQNPMVHNLCDRWKKRPEIVSMMPLPLSWIHAERDEPASPWLSCTSSVRNKTMDATGR
jgi:hypothetical protein